MKKLFTCLALLVVTLCAFSQQIFKNDVVLKLNGEELTGKVVKINDDDLDFVYANETLVYNIKKADIMKITFGSGRIEVFNKPPQSSAGNQQTQGGPGLDEHHNKVAVLPFAFVRDGQAADETVGEEVQNECYSYMSKHAGVFTVLNPRTTNAMLIKAGVTKENIKGYTMEDLCGILGVEYVVNGLVTMNKTTQTTYQSSSGSSTSKNDNKNQRVNIFSYGTATQNYQTKLNLAIYNDKGAAVYDQDRTSFWDTQDAYKLTLEYLLKRSPLYSK